MSSGQDSIQAPHVPRAAKPQRVLACVLCQQRKVKCDRTFPCSNCTKIRAQCVPATVVPRKRRRRFPERDLLARLRHYEDLLRQHKIDFEPLHPAHLTDKDSPDKHDDDDAEIGSSPTAQTKASPSTAPATDHTFEAKSFWSAMNAGFRVNDSDSDSSQDNFHYNTVHETWNQVHQYNDHLFFGVPNNVDLSPLQPSAVHIFRLWQIYLDKVNPLLKVTHTPTLQVRIIEAASNPTNINRELEALMFSIYCMAIHSINNEDCESIFGSTKKDLLRGYQFGCQQALGKCEVLRTTERDCLTALYLYLLSAMPLADPRSMSSMLGVAVRLAQRLQLNHETSNSICDPLEAEVRRRLWWALIIFDARISEMSDHKEGILAPTWDCNIPSNVNDSDLRLDMKAMPVGQTTPSEAIFAVVRAEMGRFVSRSSFYLDFTTPVLKQLPLDKLTQQMKSASIADKMSETDELEHLIQNKYLQYCDEENPTHFMTIWYARGFIYRYRLMEYYSKCAISPSEVIAGQSPAPSHRPMPPESDRQAAFQHALAMLECDTKIATSSLTQGYLWVMEHHFPVIAYFQLVQYLRRRPLYEHAERAWNAMDENFTARFSRRMDGDDSGSNPLVQFFAKVVLGSWAAREMALAGRQHSMEPLPETPQIVKGLREMLEKNAVYHPGISAKTEALASGGAAHPFLVGTARLATDVNMSMDFGIDEFPQGLPDYAMVAFQTEGDGFQNASFDASVNQLDINSMYSGPERTSGQWW